jgi:hypothetical protein
MPSAKVTPIRSPVFAKVHRWCRQRRCDAFPHLSPAERNTATPTCVCEHTDLTVLIASDDHRVDADGAQNVVSRFRNLTLVSEE